MKLIMFLTSVILSIHLSSLHAQSYDKLWKEVKECEANDRPRSAATVLNKIKQKAQKEDNYGQYLYALLQECRMRQVVVPDSFYSDMRMLQNRRDAAQNAVMRSIYAYVIADCYDRNKNCNNIDSEDYVAHDDSIHLWPKHKFVAEVKRNLEIAMKEPRILSETKSDDFVPFVKKGKDAGFFNNDLLNIIGRGAMDIVSRMPDDDRDGMFHTYYARVIDIYRQNNNREAQLWWRLDSIKRNTDYQEWYGDIMTEEERHGMMMQSERHKACMQLIAEYSDLPLVLSVYNYMLGNNMYSMDIRMKWAKEALDMYPAKTESAVVRNWVAMQTSPAFNLSLPYSVCPDESFAISLSRKNVGRISVEWYKVPADLEEKFAKMTSEEKISSCRKLAVMVKKEDFSWETPLNYIQYEEKINVMSPGYGKYYLIVSSPDMNDNSGDIGKVTVTSLRTLVQVLPGERMRFRVLDAKSGKPVDRARLKVTLLKRGKTVYADEMKGKDIVYTDAYGLAEFDFPKDRETVADISVQKDNDKYSNNISVSLYYLENPKVYATNDFTTVNMYTDRAIYRPGQTVYIGGIAYGGKDKDISVIKSADFTLILRDAYGKDIDRKVVRTDEMGVFSAAFVIPAKSVPGYWRVAVDNYYQNVGFRVEEYKRPSFFVKPDDIKGVYTQGDTINVTGKALNYNGVPLRNARVTGSSILQYMFYRMNGTHKSENLNDTVYTDDEGFFEMKVPLAGKLPYAGRFGLTMNINIEVLSSTGETQTADVAVQLGKSGMLAVDAPSRWQRTAAQPFTVTLVSGSEHKDKAVATYSIYRKQSVTDTEIQHKPVCDYMPLILGKENHISFSDNMPSGDYVMKIVCIVDGDTIKASHDFVLFDRSDRKAPEGYRHWYHVLNNTVSSDSPAEIMIGSVEKDVYLYYTLMSRDKVLEDTIYTFSDSMLTFRYDYDRYNLKDGMQAQFVFVKDGVSYVDNTLIRMAEKDRKLNFKWETFRDKLEPGSKEQWTLRITDAGNKPVKAALMATMYDASLEQFAMHKWYLNVAQPAYSPNYYFNVETPYSRYFSYTQVPVSEKVRMLEFDRFDIPGNYLYGRKLMNSSLRSVEECMEINENSVMLAAAAPKTDASVEAKVEPVPSVRTNLKETAFFYPSLKTDSKGNVTVAFTMPEGLTTWRFMALAHTADMNYGMLEQEVVASKDVMLQLSVPRYVYSEDAASLAVTVFNKLQKKISGKLKIEVFDPLTERILWSEIQKLKIDADKDSTVSFVFKPEGAYGLMACRAWYDAGNNKDGEQVYLPVFDSSERITQSKSFVLVGKKDEKINVENLFQNNNPLAEERSLTIEYADNPLWYAVMALPAVIDGNAKDAISLANTYYGLEALERMAESYPQIKDVVSQWNSENEYNGEENDAKNTAGKLMRDMSPWWKSFDEYSNTSYVLGELLDENNRNGIKREVLASLAELQYADGSFSWWSGMKGSYGMTSRVALSMARAGADAGVEGINVKAMIKFLSGTYQQSVDNYKKNHKEAEKEYMPQMWLDYMNVVSRYGKKYLDANDMKYLDYGISHLLKVRHTVAREDKAKAMFILSKAGYNKEAAELAISIKEYLVKDMSGIHFEYPSNGMYSSERKIEIHVTVMEALNIAGMMNEEMKAGMAQWLLGQKRVQAWNTPSQTVMAVEALFDSMAYSMNKSTNFVIEIKDGKNNVIDKLTGEDVRKKGLGYVSVTIDGDKLKNGLSSVNVKRDDDASMSWGSVYAQYNMPIDEVETSSSGMAIHCEDISDRLKVGQRIKQRYKLTVDKDYEYVVLKMTHAACLEPVDKKSGTVYKNGTFGYREVRDASVEYYIENLPKGHYIIEEEYFVERVGDYTNGISRLSGIYAPEFTAHANSIKINVEK